MMMVSSLIDVDNKGVMRVGVDKSPRSVAGLDDEDGFDDGLEVGLDEDGRSVENGSKSI